MQIQHILGLYQPIGPLIVSVQTLSPLFLQILLSAPDEHIYFANIHNIFKNHLALKCSVCLYSLSLALVSGWQI